MATKQKHKPAAKSTKPVKNAKATRVVRMTPKPPAAIPAMSAIRLPDMGKVARETTAIVATAASREIRSKDDYDDAAAAHQQIKRLMKAVDATFDPIARAVRDGMKATLAKVEEQRSKYRSPLEAAEESLSPKMLAWDAEQVRIAEQRAADERAREIAEVKRSALPKEERKELVESLEEAPLAAPTTVAKSQGTHFRERWWARIDDAALVPIEFCQPDEVKIGAHTRAYKDDPAHAIPGVTAMCDKTVVSRT